VNMRADTNGVAQIAAQQGRIVALLGAGSIGVWGFLVSMPCKLSSHTAEFKDFAVWSFGDRCLVYR
jgi:hypothetical protein